jgi:bacterioferritin
MENGDSITAKLFETIIDEEQKHLNYFDNVNDHLKRLGPAYLAKIAGTSASTGPASKGFVIGGGA